MLATNHRALAEEKVQLDAVPFELSTVHVALERFWSAMDCSLLQTPDERWRLQFATAIAEIAANVIRYAYANRTRGGRIGFRLRLYQDRVEARFTDRGSYFSVFPREPHSISTDPMELPESGFGLAIAHTALDQLRHHRTAKGTNVWVLEKRF